MKMRISFVLFSFFILCGSISEKIQAQDYQPMAVEGAKWLYSTKDQYPPYEHHYSTIRCEGDSLYNGQWYKKLYCGGLLNTTQGPCVALIRDDVEERKVYGVYLDVQFGACFYQEICDEVEGEEVLFFDFSIEPGDSIDLSFRHIQFDYTYDTCHTIAVCSLNLYEIPTISSSPAAPPEDLFRGKTVYLHKPDLSVPDINANYYEGIGWDYAGPLSNAFDGFQPGFRAYCIGDVDSCFSYLNSTTELFTNSWAIGPNPATEYILLENIEGSQSETTVQIVSLDGQVLKKEILNPLVSEQRISLQDIPAGLFFIVLQQGDKNQIQKMVKM